MPVDERWYDVHVCCKVRAVDEHAAEHAIIDRLDAREIPGLFPVANTRVVATNDPVEEARRRVRLDGRYQIGGAS